MDRDATVRKLLYRHRQRRLCEVHDGPLQGLRHRTVIDREDGADRLALWQEEHLPGFHVPLHLHDCEEIISVVRGAIVAEIDGEEYGVEEQESVLIPAWWAHGFRVVGSEPVRLLAIFSSNNPGIYRLDRTPTVPPWLGGTSAHLANCGEGLEREPQKE